MTLCKVLNGTIISNILWEFLFDNVGSRRENTVAKKLSKIDHEHSIEKG